MLHVVIPGHGNSYRSPNLIKNTIHLKRQFDDMHCTIYIYSDTVNLKNTSCTLKKSFGKWTNFMRDFKTKSSFIALLIDDVQLKHVNLNDMLRKMRQYNLDVIAPSIRSWHHPIMQPGYRRHKMHGNVLGETPIFSRKKCQSNLRLTRYVDMLFVLFTKKAWECWHEHLDKYNTNGWGFDLCIGIIVICTWL